MFTPPGSFLLAVLAEVAIIAFIIGAVVSLVASIVLKLRPRIAAIAIDALLGAIAALITTGVLSIGPDFTYGWVVVILVVIAVPTLNQFRRSRRLPL